MLSLATEVIEADVFRGNAPVVTHLQNCLVHHRRPAEVEFNVFRCIVVFQVVVDDRVVHGQESISVVVYALLLVPVVAFCRLRKDRWNLKLKFLLDGTRVVHVERFTLGTTAVKERLLNPASKCETGGTSVNA